VRRAGADCEVECFFIVEFHWNLNNQSFSFCVPDVAVVS
jgi:hypothetical protein